MELKHSPCCIACVPDPLTRHKSHRCCTGCKGCAESRDLGQVTVERDSTAASVYNSRWQSNYSLLDML